MPVVVLDPSNLADLEPDVLQILTEMDFLRHANDDRQLLIRGKLCAWAELYYQARGITVTYAVSPIASIMKVCPTISQDQVEELIRKYGSKLPKTPPASLADLLQKIYPAEIWMDPPSVDHLAAYMLWLWQNDTEEALQPFIRYQAELWETAYAGPAPLPYHRAYNKPTALEVLDEWLGIIPTGFWHTIGTFPKPVPQELRNRAIGAWKPKIITSEGKLFHTLLERNVPYSLLRDAGSETAQYYISHPKKLDDENVKKLQPYISGDLFGKIRQAVQPEAPASIPDDDRRVGEWFIKQYLPYREWQLSNDDPEASEIVSALARQFGEWYLRTYPEMLLGHDLQGDLCYQRMSKLASDADSEVTLVLLLDGLNLIDARELIAKIQEQIPKLSIIRSSIAYSVLPTITQFSKKSLVKGVPPKYIEQTGDIGEIISAGRFPANRLSNASGRQIFIWNIIEPDETYHKFADKPVLFRNVEAQLEGIVRKLSDVMEEVPVQLPIRVIITSDHGRLPTKSPRRIPIPEGMISHGRCAFGPSSIEFPECGFVLHDHVAYLNASRFGLLEDTVIPMNETTFLTADGKTGQDPYSHGGLYPEEVFVPWIELVREVVRPAIEIHVQGDGTAEVRGTLTVTVLNLSNDAIEVQSLELLLPKANSRFVELDWKMPARDQIVREVPLEWWPTVKQAESVKGQLTICDQNGMHFIYPCDVQLKVSEMYTTTDTLDIFDDLS